MSKTKINFNTNEDKIKCVATKREDINKTQFQNLSKTDFNK